MVHMRACILASKGKEYRPFLAFRYQFDQHLRSVSLGFLLSENVYDCSTLTLMPLLLKSRSIPYEAPEIFFAVPAS